MEIAIEQDEDSAIKWLEEQTKEAGPLMVTGLEKRQRGRGFLGEVKLKDELQRYISSHPSKAAITKSNPTQPPDI